MPCHRISNEALECLGQGCDHLATLRVNDCIHVRDQGLCSLSLNAPLPEYLIRLSLARLHDVLGTTVEGEGGSEGGEENSSESVRLYRNILRLDPTSVEAMSCLGTNDFFFFS